MTEYSAENVEPQIYEHTTYHKSYVLFAEDTEMVKGFNDY